MILYIFFLFHTSHHIYSESTLAGVGSTDWEGVCVGGKLHICNAHAHSLWDMGDERYLILSFSVRTCNL